MQTTIEQRRMRDKERYDAYRLYEEKTDLVERLTKPFVTHGELPVEDGKVYGFMLDGSKKRMTDWAEQAYREAMDDPGFNGANAIERTRRAIELDEAYAVETLRPGEMLEVLSPIPDAVMRGETSLVGYRKDLARTLGRAYFHDGATIRTVTYSLERSDKLALAAAAQARGMAIDAAMGSEQMLAARRKSKASLEEFQLLSEEVRYFYDRNIRERTGEDLYAGSRVGDRDNSFDFIGQQTDLLTEHMDALADIMAAALAADTRKQAEEVLRQRTAAAIDERLHGGIVASIGDASVSDRLETGDYGGECATGGNQSSQEQLGLAQGKHVTNCPLCGTQKVTATVEGEVISCGTCHGSVNICTGEMKRGKKVNPAPPASPERRRPPKPVLKLDELVKLKFGKEAVVRTEVTFLDAPRNVYHKQTNQYLGRL